MPKSSFYKDKHGTPGKRRIGGPRGGSDPGPGKGKKGASVAVGVALGVALLGGGIEGASVFAGADAAGGSFGRSSADTAFQTRSGQRALRQLHVRTERAKAAAKKGNRRQAWHRVRLRRSTKRHVRNTAKCVAYSHRQVREFFAHTHCRSLRRELVGLADADGNMIVVSIVRVTMRSHHDVRSLQRLIDVHGTGDVYPLGTALLELGDIRFTGRNYASRKVGNTLVVAETEPVRGNPSAEFLDSVATVAAWFPKR